MTTDIALREATSMPAVQAIAQHFVKSGFFQDTRDLSQAVVKIMAGAEMGFGPFASMKGVHIIKGQTAISAGLMAAAISRGGKYRYRIRSHTDQECSIEFFEGKESLGVASFSVKEAERADLTANPTWKRYPADMVFARAMSRGARRYCADIFAGAVYTPEELGAQVDADGAPVASVAPVIRMVHDRTLPSNMPTDMPTAKSNPTEFDPVPARGRGSAAGQTPRERSREVPAGKRWSEQDLAYFWGNLAALEPKVTSDEVHAILQVDSLHDWPDLDTALGAVFAARQRSMVEIVSEGDPPHLDTFPHPEGSIEAEWERYTRLEQAAAGWNRRYPEQSINYADPPRDATAPQVRAYAEGLERRLAKLGAP